MKRINYFFITGLLITGLFSNGFAQDDKSKRPSPPKTASGVVGDLKIAIDYGAPSVKGRTIFGGLEAYGKVWRTGANEATTFSVNKDVTIDGKPLPAGKYALFTIPEKGDWTVIFNKKADQWGAYDYDKADDALRIKVKPKKLDQVQEQLSFDVGKEGVVQFKWEYQSFDFSVSAN
jgi:hypothetical protein